MQNIAKSTDKINDEISIESAIKLAYTYTNDSDFDITNLQSHNLTYYIYDNIDTLNKIYRKITYKDTFHKNYFLKNKNWTELRDSKVLYSNHPEYSIIKNRLPGILILTTKNLFYETIKDKWYSLPFITFNIDTNYIEQIKNYISLKNELWFVKKCTVYTYGGIDIHPIYTDNNFEINLKNIIKSSNEIQEHKYNIFVLQKGVQYPLLLNNKKFDLRMYGLIVFNNSNLYVYFSKLGLIRKTLFDYKYNDINRNIQLTNTTFNRTHLNNISDYDLLTELYSPEHNLYNYFNKMQEIYADIININAKHFNTKNICGYQLLGLDFIIDNNNNIFVIEINRHPAMYYDDNIKYLHKDMEYKLFNDEFFTITIEALYKNNFIEQNTEYYNFINKIIS